MLALLFLKGFDINYFNFNEFNVFNYLKLNFYLLIILIYISYTCINFALTTILNFVFSNTRRINICRNLFTNNKSNFVHYLNFQTKLAF